MIDRDEVEAGRPWAQASLRIATDDLTSDALGELLRLAPSSTRTAEGEPHFTVWMAESGLDPAAPVEDHLYILVERLRDRREELRNLAERATVEVWLSYSPGAAARRTAIFDHDVLGELGAMAIDLVLDPYPPGGRSHA